MILLLFKYRILEWIDWPAVMVIIGLGSVFAETWYRNKCADRAEKETERGIANNKSEISSLKYELGVFQQKLEEANTKFAALTVMCHSLKGATEKVEE